MPLKEQITEDMKTAMRAKDMERLGTIRLLQAAIKQREVDEQITLDDAGVTSVLEKMLKQRKDSIAAFEQADRQDLADKEKAEVAVLQVYLPARMGEAEVQAAVQAIAAAFEAEQGRKPAASDMGKLMGAAKQQLAGKADMAQVSAAIKAVLG